MGNSQPKRNSVKTLRQSAVAEIYGEFTTDLSHQTIYQCDRRKICCKKCIFNNTKHNQKFIFLSIFARNYK